MVAIDCRKLSTREINQQLSSLQKGEEVRLQHPAGRHNFAVGLVNKINVTVEGHSGYYYGGMNKEANIIIEGNAGQGVGENMISGSIRVKGYASSAAGASAHGGTLILEKDAALRCGISLKGATILVGGSVGNMCGFMAQAGIFLICGDAGEALGDSLYEAVIYLKGNYKSLGADAREEEMEDEDYQKVEALLREAGFTHAKSTDFKRIASTRSLYHFDADKNQSY